MGKKKRKFKRWGKQTIESYNKIDSSTPYLNLSGDPPLFKEEGGKSYKLDFIPYAVKNKKKHPEADKMPEDIWYKFPYYLHRNIGPDKSSLICPKTYNKPCPICEERTNIYEDANRNDDDAKGLKASLRWLYYVIPKDDNKFEEIPHIWDISHHCFAKELKDELNRSGDMKDKYAEHAAPEDGYTLQILFKEESIGKNKYGEAHRIDFIERDDIDEEIFENLPPLEDCISILSYEKIEAIFNGVDDEDSEEEPEEEDTEEREEVEDKKPKKKSKSKSKKESEPEPDEEDEDEDEEETKDPECPEDYVFGKDFGIDEDDCDEDECDLYAECKKANKALKKEKPKKEKKEKKEKPKKEKKNKCPHGYNFGDEDDFEEHDECNEDDCPMYQKCEDKVDE